MAIDEEVQKIIQQRTGFVVVMAGSDSDKPHIDKITDALKNYDLPHQVRIMSAHKQPELVRTIDEYNDLGGIYSIIAVAGGTDALSGTASFHALAPVISCPPDAPNDSCLTNPPGSSNAYVANPKNAARFIAQMYAGGNMRLTTQLVKESTKKVVSLEKADKNLRTPYLGGK